MSDSIPQLGDPFSAAASQDTAPGFLGQSPGFWNHLAMFGGNLAAAANARTPSGHLAYGAGFAGPFGAAIGETAQQSMGQALNQARIGQIGAETVGINQQNQLNHARNSFMQMLYQNPDAMNAFMQNGTLPGAGGGGLAGGAPGIPNGVLSQGGSIGGPLAPVVANLESGGRTSTPGIFGDGGKAAGPMQVHQGALTDVNQKLGTNYSFDQLAANPQLGTQVGNVYLQMQQDKYPGRPDLALAAYNAGPGATQRAVQSGQGFAGLPVSTQNYVARGMQQAQGLPGYDPSAGFTMANQLEHEADVAERARSLGLPVSRDPAALRTAAQAYRQSALAGPTAGASEAAKLQQQAQYAPQIAGATKGAELQQQLQYEPDIAGRKAAEEAGVQLQTAGPIQAQKSANSNFDLRPGGMARAVNPQTGQPEWIKNPQLEKFETPAGVTQYGHISPALPGSPPGTPGQMEPVLGPNGQPVMEALPKNVQDQRNKAYEEFTGKEGDSYIAAQNTHQWLEQMNHAADTLNAGGGFLGTGPHAPERLAFANTVNDMLRSAGLPNAFDANKIASWEELKKATTTAGFELSSHYEGHARQAAATIENATSAVPAAANSPIGFKTVLAGIQESAQSAIDLHEYKQSVMNDPQKFVNAGVDFYKANPPQMYADRAISTVNPFKVQTPIGMNRYLPGTYVTLPNGKLTQVPERAGAPPIPTYLQQAAPGGG